MNPASPRNVTVHRAAANDIDFKTAARGSVCNGLLGSYSQRDAFAYREPHGLLLVREC